MSWEFEQSPCRYEKNIEVLAKRLEEEKKIDMINL